MGQAGPKQLHAVAAPQLNAPWVGLPHCVCSKCRRGASLHMRVCMMRILPLRFQSCLPCPLPLVSPLCLTRCIKSGCIPLGGALSPGLTRLRCPSLPSPPPPPCRQLTVCGRSLRVRPTLAATTRSNMSTPFGTEQQGKPVWWPGGETVPAVYSSAACGSVALFARKCWGHSL